MANPIRVWFYRGWCWVCWRCAGPGSPLPGAAGQGHTTLGEAADDARLHLRTECRPMNAAARTS
jgi:hypothetical protein